MSLPPAREVWSVDTEWGYSGGRVGFETAFRPVIICFVGYYSKRRIAFWGNDDRLARFLKKRKNDLFVAHNCVAEMKYLLRLGINLPTRWFDTFLAFRYVTNRPLPYPPANLSDALKYLGKPHLAPATKKALRDKILYLQFDLDSQADRAEIAKYCFSDCDGALAIFESLIDEIVPGTMDYWVRYSRAVGHMELRGIPLDYRRFELILESRFEIMRGLKAEANKTAKVYRKNGSFCRRVFYAWCRKVGIEWPEVPNKDWTRLRQSLASDVWDMMEYRHPYIKQLRDIRATLQQLADQPIKLDHLSGRSYFDTKTFQSSTGRNQPSGLIFGSAKWFRFLVKTSSPDHVLVMIDYKAQEFGMAAALSGDPALWEAYQSDDPHLDFAIKAGVVPPGSTRYTHPVERAQYKKANLALLYGQTSFGLSHSLGISAADAEAIVENHKRVYRIYWEWSEQVVQAALDSGEMKTPLGWRTDVPRDHKELTFGNFPIQGGGADIMRMTSVYLNEQNVQLLAIVHDGFLMSCHRNEVCPVGSDRETFENSTLGRAVKIACDLASEKVLPGYRLNWDYKIHDGHYFEEDAIEIWDKIRGEVLKVYPDASQHLQ